MKRKQDCLLREVAGEYLLLPTGLSAVNLNGMIVLSEPAAFVWGLLEQGPENRAERETPARALPFLLSQTTVNRWDGAFMTRALELLDGLLRQVPVFRLRCRPDEGAVACLLSALEEAQAKSPG